MNKKQAAQLEAIHDTVHHWKNEMRVNGSVGLEDILIENNTKTAEMWNATDKIRRRFKFTQTIRAWGGAYPSLKKSVDFFLDKVAAKIVWAIIFLVLSALGLDLFQHTLEQVLKYIR